MLAALVFAYFAITVRGYATEGNLYAILEACALVGIVAAGLGATMLAGELDLSVASVAACAGIIAVKMSNYGVFVAVASATVVGVVFGLVQGALIARLSIPSLVFTLGTFIGLRGVAYILSNEKTVNIDLTNLAISTNLRERFFIFSPFSLIMIAVMISVGFVLRYMRVGREIYAIGGARKESRAAGVSQSKPLLLAFALSAGLGALAGSLSSLRGASATPAGYETLLVTAVTAALIGGVSLYGGRGGMAGIFIGVLTLQFLLSGLALLGAAFWAASLATGAVLLAFLAVDLANENSPIGQAVRRFIVARKPPDNSGTAPDKVPATL
ncbi:ABC transporter permease [Williamsia muralis]|uniref:ABC transporter permease n=1 Tax=Williamsia marianensis TaxID=85044 RepID=UPI00381831B8